MGAVPEEAKQQSRSPATAAAAAVVIFIVFSCKVEQMLSIGKSYFLSKLLTSPPIVCVRACVRAFARVVSKGSDPGRPTYFLCHNNGDCSL